MIVWIGNPICAINAFDAQEPAEGEQVLRRKFGFSRIDFKVRDYSSTIDYFEYYRYNGQVKEDDKNVLPRATSKLVQLAATARVAPT